MACGTVVGAALEFGIDSDEASLTTQSVTVNRKKDKKEARDKCGIVTSVAYYNETADVSVDGLGNSTATPGSTLALSGSYGTSPGGLTFVDEISIEKQNEEFVSSSMSATQYSGIT